MIKHVRKAGRILAASGCSVAIVSAAFLWAGPAEKPAGGSGGSIPVDKIAEAGQKFQKACISCHQPPDLQFATDRAWLDQVNRTA